MTVDYKPIKMKRTYEIVADLIKKKIFSSEYQVGDRLPSERDLAELVHVSRNSVREAYHALELSGVVKIRKALRVVPISRTPATNPLPRVSVTCFFSER